MDRSKTLPFVRTFKVFNNHLQVNFSPSIALFRTDQDALFGTNVVKRLHVNNRLQHASPNILRWKVVTHVSSKALPLGTQRSRLRRRWSQAFIEALKRQGMDAHGKSLPGWKDRPRKNELSGTLEVLVLQAYGFSSDAPSLARDADKVVIALLQSGLGNISKRNMPQSSG